MATFKPAQLHNEREWTIAGDIALVMCTWGRMEQKSFLNSIVDILEGLIYFLNYKYLTQCISYTNLKNTKVALIHWKETRD